MNNNRWKTLMVVVADPFAAEQPAVTKAVAIALRTGARLVLFNSFMLPQPIADVPMDSQSKIIAAAVRQRRERMQSLLARSGLSDTKCVVEWDYPAHEAIIRQVLKTKPDLLMTASHRRGRLARWLLANTDWELMRMCPCPVWFVRSAALGQRLSMLVAVDPLHAHEKPARLDDRLLHTAGAIASQFNGHISIVHACEIPEGAQPVRSMVLATAEQAVNDLAVRHGVDEADCDVKIGRPEDVIASLDRRNYVDVLVMGVVSRSVSGHPVIGNTAERVIDNVSCDVLVVKPAGFKAPSLSTAKPSVVGAKSRTVRKRAA